MVSALARLTVAVFALGTVQGDAGVSCPWNCFCYLNWPPITVNCSGLSLDAFPTDIDTRVNWLDLSDNLITAVPNLDRYTELEILELAHNRIQHISAASFNNLINLRSLDLSHNEFTDWIQLSPVMLLQNLKSLKTLKLSNNILKSFTGEVNHTPIESSSLEVLNLSSCSILRVRGEALRGFTSIQTLDLSFNQIKWLDDLSSSTLTFLDLSHCDIDSMSPNALDNLPSLTTFRISGNANFAINHGNLTSASLQTFEAESCSLAMPGLHGFPNLTLANLRGNKITALTERCILRNRLLVELDLSANEIFHIHPQAFVGARQLAFVNLSANALHGTIHPNTFSTNFNLKTLDLSMNRLQSVGNLSIMMLQNLDLSQCQIKEIRNDSLRNLPWLAYLNLSNNPIERIPDNIQAWYLKQLDLSYCRLSIITNETFRRMPAIERINLIGNRFTNTFRVEMFANNEQLYYLQLANNPWICECTQEFKLFWEFLIYYPRKAKDSERAELKCMSPDSVAGKSWIQACYGTWYPYDGPESSFSFTHYGTAIVILLIVAAGIFAIVGMIKRRIKRLIKEEQEAREREMGENQDHAAVVFRLRENSDAGHSDSSEVERHGREDSRLTQPPTYEEAMQMVRASREDIVSAPEVQDRPENETRTQPVKGNRTDRSGARSADSDDSGDVQGSPENEAQTQPVRGNRTDRSGACSATSDSGDVQGSPENEAHTQPVRGNRTDRSGARSADSDDSGDEDNQPQSRVSEHSGDNSVGSDDSDEEKGASKPLNRQK